MQVARSLFSFPLSLALLALAPSARADLASEADLVAATWAAEAGRAERMRPVFLEYGRLRTLSLPTSAYDESSPSCTSVALLTERSTDFVVRLDPIARPKQRATPSEVKRSAAGAVTFVRCGPEKAALARLSVELRVARAALEVIVAEGVTPAPPIATVLPDRATGPLAPLPDPGPQRPLEPLDIRVARAEARVKRASASEIRKSRLTPDAHGAGYEILQLDEGCHRIELFPEQMGPGYLDLDAEARDVATERILARDRSDSPDARLELCVGAPSPVKLAYAGARGSSEVVLTDAIFPLPEGVPGTFGPRARAGMAAALRRRQVVALKYQPDSVWLGVAGPTSIPIEVEPGACYLATVAATRGELRYVSLSAHVDARTAFDSNAGLFDGTAVAFCVESRSRAMLEVDARGLSIAWAMGLWKLGRIGLGEER